MGDMADWVNDDSPWDGLGLSPEERREHDAREAVIEAAKAFVEANKSLDGDEWATYDALEKAVEALEEVEDPQK